MSTFSEPSLENDIKDSFSTNELAHASYTWAERLAYHRVVLVDQASGELQIDDVNFSVSDHQLILMAKGQIYQGSNLHLSGYELSFGDCFWERSPQSSNNCKAVLFNNAAANQMIPLGPKDYQELRMLFNALHQEHRGPDYVNKLDAMAAYLKIIMIKIANVNAALVHGYDDHDKQLYRQFLQLVSQQYKSLHDVTYYADLLHVSARRLSDVCKSCCGQGAKQIINGQLVAEAKRSLQFSSLPVKEIAYQLHFSTPEQFSHFFKKNVHTSPSDYRTRFVNIGR